MDYIRISFLCDHIYTDWLGNIYLGALTTELGWVKFFFVDAITHGYAG